MPEISMLITRRQWKTLNTGGFLSKTFNDVLEKGDVFIVIIGKRLNKKEAQKEIKLLLPIGNVLPCNCNSRIIRQLRQKSVTFKFPDRIRVHVSTMERS
jgi:hypothetical protein